MARTVKAVWVVVVGSLLAVTSPVCAQERPPRPLEARDVKIPPYEIRTMPNGLRVVVVSQDEQPAVSLRLLVRAGSAQDPATKPGVAAMVGALLDQGTAKRSSEQISDTIDYVGGALGSGAGTDLSYVSILVLKDSFDLALGLISEVVESPSFPQEELDRVREQALSAISVNMQDPDYVADRAINRLVYGFHPYGLPGNGTPQSLAAITRDDLVSFHKTWFAPANALLAVVGDVSPEEAFAGVTRAFGGWTPRDTPSIEAMEVPEAARRLVLIDRPNAVQTEIRAGHVAIARKHPDYMALNLATKILGGEGANRLQNVLRSERGLTYGASADMDAFKQAGAIIAETDTQTSTTGEALRLTVDEFSRLVREPVGERELMGAQAYLAGSFPLGLETADDIALQVLNLLFFDLDVKELETYPDRVNKVTSDDIQRVARQFIKPQRLSIVLVGDATLVLPQLKAVGFDDVEVLPLGDLDLTSPSLRGKPAPTRAPAPGR
ncbi:MAG: insulinase family protein [Acidobacteria bacterium]|nr:insulinase family protein [Acidobacteriota bacterium]